jgi:hypothetical protein
VTVTWEVSVGYGMAVTGKLSTDEPFFFGYNGARAGLRQQESYLTPTWAAGKRYYSNEDGKVNEWI